jgi:ribose 1,5-bisphosphokinase
LSEHGKGGFVAVVGPSGAGKDSLIAAARQALGEDRRFSFVRRVVTRPAEASAEDHDSMSFEAFESAAAEGRFVVTWQAHGLHYGLPSHSLAHVNGGGIAVANCSRAALSAIGQSFPRLSVILVSAAPAVLAQRLAGRGRESAADIEQRLLRTVDDFPGREKAIVIDNSGQLEDAAQAFIRTLRGFAT